MTQTISVPGVGDVEFPDGMSSSEMETAIKLNYFSPNLPDRDKHLANFAAALQSKTAEDSLPEVLARSVASGIEQVPAQLGGATQAFEENVVPRFFGGYQPTNIGQTVADYYGKVAQEIAPQTNRGSIKDIVSQVGQSAPMMGAALATGGLGLPSMAIAAGGGTYHKQMEDRKAAAKKSGVEDPWMKEKSLAAGAVSGVAEYLGEMLPFEAIKRGGSNLLRRILESTVKEAPGEALTQFIQSTVEKVTTHPEMTWEQVLDDAKLAGIVGGAMGGTMAVAAHPFVKSAERANQNMRDQLAQSLNTEPQGTPLKTAPQEPVIGRDEKINDITRRQAGEMIANGDPAVVEHIVTGVKEGRVTITQAEDAIRNEELARIQETPKTERPVIRENMAKVDPLINEVFDKGVSSQLGTASQSDKERLAREALSVNVSRPTEVTGERPPQWKPPADTFVQQEPSVKTPEDQALIDRMLKDMRGESARPDQSPFAILRKNGIDPSDPNAEDFRVQLGMEKGRNGGLFRKGGYTLDQAREAISQELNIPLPTINDFISYMEDAQRRGLFNETTSRGATNDQIQAETEANLRHFREEIASDFEVDPNSISDAELARVWAQRKENLAAGVAFRKNPSTRRPVSAELSMIADKIRNGVKSLTPGDHADLNIAGDVEKIANVMAVIEKTGGTVEDYLKQQNMFGDTLSGRERRMLELHAQGKLIPQLREHVSRIESLGVKQGDMFGEKPSAQSTKRLSTQQTREPVQGTLGITEGPQQDMAFSRRPSDVAGEQYQPTIEERQNQSQFVPTMTPDEGADMLRKSKIVAPERIIVDFMKGLDTNIQIGRLRGLRKEIEGFHNKNTRAMGARSPSLETVAHEVAHELVARDKGIKRAWTFGKQATAFREELKNVSYDKRQAEEGFAEFIRLWMTQPEEAANRVPTFTKWWESHLEKAPYKDTVNTAREAMIAWYKQDPLLQGASKIGEHNLSAGQKAINATKKTLGLPVVSPSVSSIIADVEAGYMDKIRIQTADDLWWLNHMEKKLKGNVSYTGGYWASRFHRDSHSFAKGVLMFGIPDDTQPNGFRGVGRPGKGLYAILEQVEDGDLERWVKVAVSYSAAELMEQGRENLFTRDQIKAFRALEKPGDFEIFKEWLEFNEGVVQFAISKGLISKEQRAAWRRAMYLPFYRIIEDKPSSGRKVWTGIKKLTGGRNNLRDIVANMVQNTEMFIVKSLENEARLKSLELCDEEGGGVIGRRVPKEAMPFNVTPESIIAIAKKNSPDIDPVFFDAIEGALPENFQLWDRMAPKGEKIQMAFKNGKPVYYEIIDPLFLDALNFINHPARNEVMKILNNIRTLATKTITVSTQFMMGNMPRDQMQAAVFNRYGYNPLDFFRGAWSVLKEDATYQRLIANRAIGYGDIYRDTSDVQNEIDEKVWNLYNKKNIGKRVAKGILLSPKHLAGLLEKLGEVAEQGTRVGVAKRVEAAGKSKEEVAGETRTVTSDFTMRGQTNSGIITKLLGIVYDSVPFTKAGVVSFDNELRRGLSKDLAVRVAMKTALIAAVTMINYMMNRDRKEFKELTPYARDAYWHFFIDFPDGTTGHYKLVKPYGFVGFAATMSERVIEQMARDENQELLPAFGRALSTMFLLDVVPAVAKPVYEVFGVNKNTFTGVPIETPADQRKPEWTRTAPHISPTINRLAEKTSDTLNFSPKKADALLNGFLHYWAMYGLFIVDKTLYPEYIQKEFKDVIGFNRFVEPAVPYKTKSEIRFYQALDDAIKVTDEIKTLATREEYARATGEITTAEDLKAKRESKERTNAAQYKSALSGIDRRAMEINRAIRKEQEDVTRPKAEREKNIEQLRREKNALFEQAGKETKGFWKN